MKQHFFILAALLLSFSTSSLKAQNVNIPDPVFKSALLSSGVNANLDFEIQLSEAQNYTGLININGLAISDHTGLEEFVNLTRLHCTATSLSSLDISMNTMLTELHCGNNSFTSLDVSNNVNLTHLECFGLQITNLDLSNNTNLIEFDCRQDSVLTAINIKNGNNTAITSFQANSNPMLTCIDVDNVAYSTANWTNIDAGVVYTTSCFTNIITTNDIENLQVYPNPTQNALTVDLGTIHSTINITVFNTIGQRVQSFNHTNTESLDLNLEGLPGWYFIQIETEKGSRTIKVLKQ